MCGGYANKDMLDESQEARFRNSGESSLLCNMMNQKPCPPTVELSIGLSTVGLSTVVYDNSRGYKRQAVRATTDRQHGLQQTGSTVYNNRQAVWSTT